MGSSKIKLLFTIILLLVINSNADDFLKFKQDQQKEFQQFKQSIDEEFKNYQIAHKEALLEFSKELNQKWPTKNGKVEISTKEKFVQYNKNLNSKQVIDYKNKIISLEVIAKNHYEAKKKIEKQFNKLLVEDVKTAYKKDILENKISKKLKKKQLPIKSNQKLIADIITQQEKKMMQDKLKKQNLIITKHKGRFFYKANIKMPADSTIKKAKIFKKHVIKYSEKQQILPELVYAIIHSESSFNPMARSHIPAFGLMQIVPGSAGIDSYKYLYKKRRLLSSSYLYDPEKNITIGSGYLHILYYKYLKKIKDPQSRLYCTIAAYNTGAGNVAKTFIGNTNINKAALTINQLAPKEVYTKLMKNLPYLETKKYLKKVNDRIYIYNRLLEKTL